MKLRGIISLIMLVSVIAIVSSSAETPSDAAALRRTATLAEVKGSVEVKPSTPKAVWVRGPANTALAEGDIIRTGNGSSAIIHISGDTENASIELGADSQITIINLAANAGGLKKNLVLSLETGEALVKTKRHEAGSVIEIQTPTSTVMSSGGSATFTVKAEKVE